MTSRPSVLWLAGVLEYDAGGVVYPPFMCFFANVHEQNGSCHGIEQASCASSPVHLCRSQMELRFKPTVWLVTCSMPQFA